MGDETTGSSVVNMTTRIVTCWCLVGLFEIVYTGCYVSNDKKAVGSVALEKKDKISGDKVIRSVYQVARYFKVQINRTSCIWKLRVSVSRLVREVPDIAPFTAC
jgi:hypothetical protein